MDENDVVEIDLMQVLAVVKKNLLLFMAICILTCTAGFAISKFVMAEKFTATAKIIIVKDDNTSTSAALTTSDISLSQKLAATYKQIIMSEAISDTVIDNLNLKEKYNMTSTTYGNIVSVEAADNTEVMNIKVQTSDPQLSANIANEIVNVFISKIYDIMEVQNVSILNSAKVPTKKSAPSVSKYTLIGGLIGMVICAGIALLQVLLDTKVKSEEEVKAILATYPIIGSIPNFLEKEIEYDDDNE